jgi:YVTN family beta-propeller protein
MRTFFRKRRGIVAASFIAAIGAASALLAAGCANTAGSTASATPAYSTYLYMTDGKNGYVYTYDPATHASSSSALLTTSTNSAGEVKFFKGIGYVAMGYGGIYYFDPSAMAPSATLISGSGSVDAEYFAFYGSTKAYVSVAGTYDTSGSGGTGAVYSFDPSSPGKGLTQVDGARADKYMQEIVAGPDNYIYVAEELSQNVLRIDPSTDKVVATIPASRSGTTGICSGAYDGISGVFVANLGGSIDFIPSATSAGASSTNVDTVVIAASASPIYPGRLVQLANGNLVATGYDTSYADHTYYVTLSGATATVREIKGPNDESFGNLSIAYDSSSGLVYVPYHNYSDNGNKLYVFDPSGVQQSYSPVSVMTSNDAIANVAFYQD